MNKETALKVEQIEIVQQFLDTIPKDLLAYAAYNCKSYDRALMYYEEFIEIKQKQQPQSGNGNIYIYIYIYYIVCYLFIFSKVQNNFGIFQNLNQVNEKNYKPQRKK